jgi:hypothetical protein
LLTPGTCYGVIYAYCASFARTPPIRSGELAQIGFCDPERRNVYGLCSTSSTMGHDETVVTGFRLRGLPPALGVTSIRGRSEEVRKVPTSEVRFRGGGANTKNLPVSCVTVSYINFNVLFNRSKQLLKIISSNDYIIVKLKTHSEISSRAQCLVPTGLIISLNRCDDIIRILVRVRRPIKRVVVHLVFAIRTAFEPWWPARDRMGASRLCADRESIGSTRISILKVGAVPWQHRPAGATTSTHPTTNLRTAKICHYSLP